VPNSRGKGRVIWHHREPHSAAIQADLRRQLAEWDQKRQDKADYEAAERVVERAERTAAKKAETAEKRALEKAEKAEKRAVEKAEKAEKRAVEKAEKAEKRAVEKAEKRAVEKAEKAEKRAVESAAKADKRAVESAENVEKRAAGRSAYTLKKAVEKVSTKAMLKEGQRVASLSVKASPSGYSSAKVCSYVPYSSPLTIAYIVGDVLS